MQVLRTPSATMLAAIVAIATTSACSSRRDTRADSATTSSAAGAVSAASASDSASSRGPTDITPVRGTLATVSDTVLAVKTATGEVRVKLEPPLRVYTRQPSDLSHVTDHTF